MINPKTKLSENKQLNRLVFFSFNPELLENEKNIQIDHINGKRDDNRLENLRAVTAIENITYKDNNQNDIKTIVTQLVLKYGYEETKNKLIALLNKGE